MLPSVVVVTAKDLRSNATATVFEASMVRVQTGFVPTFAQSPDQEVKTEPFAGVAVKVTTVSKAKEARQSEPQLIPTGSLVTTPEPFPDLLTVRG